MPDGGPVYAPAGMGYLRRMKLERIDLGVKAAALGLMALAAIMLLAGGLMLLLLGQDGAKLAGGGSFSVGLVLWTLTFWLIGDRPASWVAPEVAPSHRRRWGR